MSRRKKKPRPRKTTPPPHDDREAFIRRRAKLFSCPNALAGDFGLGCQTLREDLGLEIDYARVAIHAWSGRTGCPPDLVAVLSALLDEHRRHDAALAALATRFNALCFEEASAHEHIDPIEPLHQLLKDWVFDGPPQD